jgi:hypothetical protein
MTPPRRRWAEAPRRSEYCSLQLAYGRRFCQGVVVPCTVDALEHQEAPFDNDVYEPSLGCCIGCLALG